MIGCEHVLYWALKDKWVSELAFECEVEWTRRLESALTNKERKVPVCTVAQTELLLQLRSSSGEINCT